ncbi:MAG: hypothetical protein JWQ37_3698, partial [Blastococcus sp.]|nr:hypothetical protein [Blastococcus sp.]
MTRPGPRPLGLLIAVPPRLGSSQGLGRGGQFSTVARGSVFRRRRQQEWDAAVRERFESAHDRPGWVSGQLLTPEGEEHTRVIIGTWRSREDWAAWHEDPA